MPKYFDTLLLLALPASGKSEVRNFLTHKDPEGFHMGPTVQIDDYPYVHMQLRVDEELLKLGRPKVYHRDDDDGGRNGPFMDGHEWGALIQLLNEDFQDLQDAYGEKPERATHRLFQRLDAASERAGGAGKIRSLPLAMQGRLADMLEGEARQLFLEKAANTPASLEDKTVVIEFARGGPQGATMPLTGHHGYQYALQQLSDEILQRAAILYIWVDPEESRRKNRERARPDGQGSILFHGTPESVMREEYGCDDMAYLIDTSDVPGTIRVEKGEQVFHVPVARFDNRQDKTTFLRKPPSDWTEAEIQQIYGPLKEACDQLWTTWSKDRP
ncbi:MAG: hypothetical protein RBU45_23080 [Myxococcota bacterium]|jgi:hypothetical protein|nr:hypothetical protein [Myxococcota bacterium]